MWEERSPCQDHYFSAATPSLVGGAVPCSHSEDSPFRHLPDSHPDHSAAKPEPVQQKCLSTLVPDLVVVKVKGLRCAAFQTLRHDLRQLPHAPVAKDFPPGRRSNPMFSVVENSGWETNPKHHYANNSFHVETICWSSPALGIHTQIPVRLLMAYSYCLYPIPFYTFGCLLW